MLIKYLVCLLAFVSLIACQEEVVPFPKDRVYPKVVYPSRNYIQLDKDACAFTFRHPDYMVFERDSMLVMQEAKHPCWFTLQMPQLGGSLHMTYTDIGGDSSDFKLYDVIKDAYALSEKHNPKSTGRNDEIYQDTSRNLYGITFDVSGDVASPYHFVLTDSTSHAIWGSLYFNATPNADSLRPVVNFVLADVDTILSSLKWKN